MMALKVCAFRSYLVVGVKECRVKRMSVDAM
jgi:hypothetical protein